MTGGLLALNFLFAAFIRVPRSIQGRTWLLIAATFAAISGWLFATTRFGVS